MNLPSGQRGLSALSMLVILLVAVFFGTCAIKMSPTLIEYSTVKRTTESVVEMATANKMTNAEIRGAFSKRFQVNMTDVIDARAVKITRANGQTTINANYEVRLPLMFNIDVVLKFENLVYTFASSPPPSGT